MTPLRCTTLIALLCCLSALVVAVPGALAQDATMATTVEQFTPLNAKGRLATGFVVVVSASRATQSSPSGPGCIQYPNASRTITCAVPGKRYDACWFAPGQAHSRDVFFCVVNLWSRQVVRISLPRVARVTGAPLVLPTAWPMAIELTDGQRCALPTVVDATAPEDLFVQGYDCGGGLRLDKPAGTFGGLWTANAYVIEGDHEYTDGTRTVGQLVMATRSSLPRGSTRTRSTAGLA